MEGTRVIFVKSEQSKDDAKKSSARQRVRLSQVIDVPIYCERGYMLDVNNQCQEVWED